MARVTAAIAKIWRMRASGGPWVVFLLRRHRRNLSVPPVSDESEVRRGHVRHRKISIRNQRCLVKCASVHGVNLFSHFYVAKQAGGKDGMMVVAARVVCYAKARDWRCSQILVYQLQALNVRMISFK